MKVGIVTGFKTENPGSYFQAWALQHKLGELGAHVAFVKYNVLSENRLNYITELLKSCVKLNFRRAFNLLKRTKRYKKLRKNNGIIAMRKNNADAYVYGSDTIWNTKIFMFFDAIKRINKIQDATLLLQGAYSGFASLKGVDKTRLDWAGEI